MVCDATKETPRDETRRDTRNAMKKLGEIQVPWSRNSYNYYYDDYYSY